VCSSDLGVFCYDYKNPLADPLVFLRGKMTGGLLLDKEGNIWMLQRGLLYASIPGNKRLQSREITNTIPGNFSRPQMRGIYFDTTSYLLYCTFLGGEGVHVYDTNLMLRKVLPTALLTNYFNYNSTIDNKITKDGNGWFWTVGWKVFVMQPGENRFSPVEKNFHH